MVAAMMDPTASDIEWPELAQTCAANSVAISRPRCATIIARRLRASPTSPGGRELRPPAKVRSRGNARRAGLDGEMDRVHAVDVARQHVDRVLGLRQRQ